MAVEKEENTMSDKNQHYLPKVQALVVVGTRPEAIKLFPVIHALKKSRITPIVVNSGQHADMTEEVLTLAGIQADYNLKVAHPGQTVSSLTETIMARVNKILEEMRGGPEKRRHPRMFSQPNANAGKYPSFTIVHGDTTTAAAAGMASAFNRLPVIHVEAGLRTGNINSPFPEEINRQLLSKITAFHLAPMRTNKETLIREGIDVEQIFVTGNTSIDAVRWVANLDVPWSDPQLNRVDTHTGPIIVATAHRRENWGEGLANIAESLASIATTRPDALIVVPLHPNPSVKAQLVDPLLSFPNIILTEALDYPNFARLLKRASLAISDSGGIQEEAPSLGTPVIVNRDHSERMEGVDAGVLFLTGTRPSRIVPKALEIMQTHLTSEGAAEKRVTEDVFGDGKASERIVAALEHLVFNTPAPYEFGSPFSRDHILRWVGYQSDEVEKGRRLYLDSTNLDSI